MLPPPMGTRVLRCALEPEGISKSYVSRILRLALLAPDIIEAILAGRTDHGMMLGELERPLPACWEEQLRHPALALAARS